MKLLYIAGTSHSGTTLLELMLNAHPRIFAVGEAINLNRVRHRKSGTRRLEKCSCRALSLQDCEFWSRVDCRLKKEGMGLRTLALNDFCNPDPWRATNLTFFRAVSAVSGKKIIVDSSKSPGRLTHLLESREFEVYPIHLIRNPKGQVTSVMRKQGFWRAILFYELVHHQIRQALRSIPHTVVKYEDLVTTPETTLQRILGPLGLEFDPRQLAWAEQPKHTIAGNHLRFQTTSKLQLDESWKFRLSRAQKLMIDIGTVNSQLRFSS